MRIGTEGEAEARKFAAIRPGEILPLINSHPMTKVMLMLMLILMLMLT